MRDIAIRRQPSDYRFLEILSGGVPVAAMRACCLGITETPPACLAEGERGWLTVTLYDNIRGGIAGSLSNNITFWVYEVVSVDGISFPWWDGVENKALMYPPEEVEAGVMEAVKTIVGAGAGTVPQNDGGGYGLVGDKIFGVGVKMVVMEETVAGEYSMLRVDLEDLSGVLGPVPAMLRVRAIGVQDEEVHAWQQYSDIAANGYRYAFTTSRIEGAGAAMDLVGLAVDMVDELGNTGSIVIPVFTAENIWLRINNLTEDIVAEGWFAPNTYIAGGGSFERTYIGTGAVQCIDGLIGSVISYVPDTLVEEDAKIALWFVSAQDATFKALCIVDAISQRVNAFEITLKHVVGCTNMNNQTEAVFYIVNVSPDTSAAPVGFGFTFSWDVTSVPLPAGMAFFGSNKIDVTPDGLTGVLLEPLLYNERAEISVIIENAGCAITEFEILFGIVSTVPSIPLLPEVYQLSIG